MALAAANRASSVLSCYLPSLSPCLPFVPFCCCRGDYDDVLAEAAGGAVAGSA